MPVLFATLDERPMLPPFISRTFGSPSRNPPTGAANGARAARESAGAEAARRGWLASGPLSGLIDTLRASSPGRFRHSDSQRSASRYGPAITGRSITRLGRSAARADASYHAQLTEYARNYVTLQRLFNGERPEEVTRLTTKLTPQMREYPGTRYLETVWLQENATGQCPYWDIDAVRLEAAGVKIRTFGELEGTPVLDNGRVRVRAHYASQRGIERLVEKFGEPDGHDAASMTDSRRTLMLETQAGPILMKFSGAAMPRIGQFKKLAADHIEAAVIASAELSAYSEYGEEPAGLAIDLGDGKSPITQLYRVFPIARRGYREGDVVLPEHVLSDPEFEESDLGRRIFSLHGSRRKWLRHELAPQLADFLWLTLTQIFVHPQLHGQNLDLIIDATGKLVEIRLKDLQDVEYDFPAAAAAGRIAERWQDRPSPNHLGFRGAENEDSESARIATFYYEFLSQLCERDIETPEDPQFSAEVARELVERARQRLDLSQLSEDRAFAKVFGPTAWRKSGTCIASVRQLIISSREANLRIG